MIDKNWIFNKVETLLYPVGLRNEEDEINDDIGIGMYKIVILDSIPSIDYYQYKLQLTLNYGSNAERDLHYDINLDRSIRQCFEVTSVKPGDKGLVVILMEVIY